MISRSTRARALRFAATAIVTVACACSATACATRTSTTSTWSATSPVPYPIKHVLVFGGGTLETHRRSLEDGVTATLRRQGIDAKPSYTMFPTLPDRDQARAATRDAGIDGALVVAVRAVRERQTYVPPSYRGGFWGGYYGPGWGGMYSPGYVVTDEVVSAETTLWDVRGDGVLVWSSTTQTTNPRNMGDFVRSLAKEVVPNLLDAKLIATRTRD